VVDSHAMSLKPREEIKEAESLLPPIQYCHYQFYAKPQRLMSATEGPDINICHCQRGRKGVCGGRGDGGDSKQGSRGGVYDIFSKTMSSRGHF